MKAQVSLHVFKASQLYFYLLHAESMDIDQTKI